MSNTIKYLVAVSLGVLPALIICWIAYNVGVERGYRDAARDHCLARGYESWSYDAYRQIRCLPNAAGGTAEPFAPGPWVHEAFIDGEWRQFGTAEAPGRLICPDEAERCRARRLEQP